MGLAFLPWERLPAYVFGPLFIALNSWLLWMDHAPSEWHTWLALGGVTFGMWVIWSRYRTGEEPLWTDKQRAAARRE